MADLQLTDQIAANGQYTYLFQVSGGIKPLASDCVTKILAAGLPIDNVNGSYQGGIFGFGSSVLRVTFTWTQAGWSVQQVAQNIEGALDNTIGNFDFLTATGGWPTGTIIDQLKATVDLSTGEANGNSGSYASTKDEPGSTSNLIWLGIVGVIIIAVLFGASSFARGLAERV